MITIRTDAELLAPSLGGHQPKLREIGARALDCPSVERVEAGAAVRVSNEARRAQFE